MKELGQLLRDSDPVAGESFPVVAIDRMLGRLRHEAEGGDRQTGDDRVRFGVAWRVTATSLACAAVVLVAAVAQRESRTGRVVVVENGPERGRVQRADQLATAVVPVRQLQFATPEGIRVFWTFDPDFQEN